MSIETPPHVVIVEPWAFAFFQNVRTTMPAAHVYAANNAEEVLHLCQIGQFAPDIYFFKTPMFKASYNSVVETALDVLRAHKASGHAPPLVFLFNAAEAADAAVNLMEMTGISMHLLPEMAMPFFQSGKRIDDFRELTTHCKIFAPPKEHIPLVTAALKDSGSNDFSPTILILDPWQNVPAGTIKQSIPHARLYTAPDFKRALGLLDPDKLPDAYILHTPKDDDYNFSEDAVRLLQQHRALPGSKSPYVFLLRTEDAPYIAMNIADQTGYTVSLFKHPGFEMFTGQTIENFNDLGELLHPYTPKRGLAPTTAEASPLPSPEV